MSECENDSSHRSLDYCRTCGTCHTCVDERIAGLEAKVAAMEWTEVESGGMPDEAGCYLCAFSDGSVEAFNIYEQMIADGGWEIGYAKPVLRLTHWTANPAHPTRA